MQQGTHEVIHPDGDDDDADNSKRKPPVVEGREEEAHKKQKLPKLREFYVDHIRKQLFIMRLERLTDWEVF